MKQTTIDPPAWIGVVGGGQLGRMFADAARAMGYRVAVYTNEANSPAAQAADRIETGAYDDAAAVGRFATGVEALTFEFENIAAEAGYAALKETVVRPHPRILEIVQQRFREKEFLRSHGFATAPYRLVETAEQLEQAVSDLGGEGVFKTVLSGYDGHGQARVGAAGGMEKAKRLLLGGTGIVEGWIDFRCELSVIVARNPQGEMATYGPLLNDHDDHILDVSVIPSGLGEPIESRAVELARGVAEALDLEGLVCVEMFLTRSDELLVNELAPRPHNSGHLTIEAFEASQYEQQVRTLCGLPLGSTKSRAPAAAMANLLGDLWIDGAADADAASSNGTFVHLYGKAEPRRRRKMGHITAVADTVDEARSLVLEARAAFSGVTTRTNESVA